MSLLLLYGTIFKFVMGVADPPSTAPVQLDTSAAGQSSEANPQNEERDPFTHHSLWFINGGGNDEAD